MDGIIRLTDAQRKMTMDYFRSGTLGRTSR
jgi:hypothetical protein